ncbi:mCG1041748, partial [Mus musculus]
WFTRSHRVLTHSSFRTTSPGRASSTEPSTTVGPYHSSSFLLISAAAAAAAT